MLMILLQENERLKETAEGWTWNFSAGVLVHNGPTG